MRLQTLLTANSPVLSGNLLNIGEAFPDSLYIRKNFKKCVNNTRIKFLPALTADFFEDLVLCPGLFIHPFAGQRIVDVGKGNYPSRNGYFFTFKPPRFPAFSC